MLRSDSASMWVLATLATLLVSPGATAHEDLTVVDGAFGLAAGETRVFGAELHYHRALGEARVISPENGAVVMTIRERAGASEPVGLGRGAHFRINEVVRCCDSAAWAPHDVLVHNPGERAVEVNVRLVLVHDNMAVLADDAETGAVASAFVMYGGVAAAAAALLRRPATPRGAAAFAWASAGTQGAMWLVAGSLGALGAARYGGGLVAGLLGFSADLPRPSSEFVNGQVFVLLALMGLWAAAVLLWAGAARRAQGPERRFVGIVGAALGSGAVIAWALWGIEARAFAVPALLGVTTAIVPLVGALRLVARARAT